MKKFFIRLTGFILIAALSYILLLIIWNRFGYTKIKANLNYRIAQGGHLFTRLREVENYGEVDVLVIGSSHAYRGFDPRVFQKHQLKMFNLGSSAQTPIQTEILLNRYINKLRPKVVLIEVFPNTITTDDGIESSLDLISNSISNDEVMLDFVLNCKNIKVINTFLVAKIFEIINRNLDFIEDKIKGNDAYVAGGFVQNQTNNFGECKNTNVSFLINQNQINAINRIETKMKEEGINLFFYFRTSYTNIL